MPIYINRERPLNHATSVRSRALEKAERYESIRRAFTDWAGQAGISEEEFLDGLRVLEELIDFWRQRAEVGET